MRSRHTVSSAKRHFVLGLVLCAALALFVPRAAVADYGFVIGHAPPGVVQEGRDVTLPALVQSTCTVGSCGEIRFVVIYQTAEDSAFQYVMLPPQKTQLATVTIPGLHVRAPALTFRLAAYQTRCLWHCSIASTETITYRVMVRRG